MDKQFINYNVVQSNILVRYFRHDATWNLQRLKCYLFIVSLINPDDEPNTVYHFEINTLMEKLKMTDAGKNYQDIKDHLKAFRDCSQWMKNKKGNLEAVSILHDVEISEKTGEVTLQFHELIQPYLFYQRRHFTLETLETLYAFDYKYTPELYLFLFSFFGRNCHEMWHEVELTELKERLCCQYDRWPDIKRYVVDTAVEEINAYSTNMKIKDYEAKIEKNKVVSLTFHLKEPTEREQDNALMAIEQQEKLREKRKHGKPTEKTKQKKEQKQKAEEKLKEIESKLTTGATLEEIAESTREYINLRREAEQPKLQWEGRENG